MLRPLCAELVGSSETAVSAADDERVDAVLDKVVRGLAASLDLPERSTPGSTDEGATDAREAPHVVPSDLRHAQTTRSATPLARTGAGEGTLTRMM